MNLEIGKVYKTQSGRLIKIVNHDPEWSGGMYWGSSIDNQEPKLDHERWTPDARWWSYISPFSMFGFQELRNEKLNLIEEVVVN